MGPTRSPVRFRTLNNRVIPVSLPEEEVDDATTLATFWDHARGRFLEAQGRKKGEQGAGAPDQEQEEPLLFGGMAGNCKPRNPNETLRMMGMWLGRGIGPSTLTVIPVWRQLQALPTKAANSIPDPSSGLPVRPPAAFKTKQQLGGGDGHVLLLEHFEERPMFMLQPGMGVRLGTYYRRRGDDDTGHAALTAELRSARAEGQALPPTSAEPIPPGAPRPPWMIGTAHTLEPDSPSPFLDLGQIAPGTTQFAVDAGCYRAPASAHTTAATDFLLIRTAGSAALQLREITGTVLVGQQHPAAPVWAPGSQDAVRFEESRLQAYVRRSLINAQQRLEKRADASGVPPQATVSLAELISKFSRTGLSKEGAIQKLLTEDCECVPVGAPAEGLYALRPDAKQLSEAELRKLVTPELCARYEALLAGIGFRNSMGLNVGALAEMEAIREKAPERLGVALEQLPLHSEGRQAAAIVEMALVAAPWHLSEAYQHVLREGRPGMLLALTGIGDPTGRGRGFSFVREDARRLAREEAKPAEGLARREDGTITGTDADLRKLPHARAGELLRTKFNMSAEEVDALGRWARIDAIRTKCRPSRLADATNPPIRN
ncbi:Transcription initiation factor TFIID subunit 1 [Monoraphidium neglectum]|uniref:Transcription initiation factor TFIID subunit 1 n=1 Tax=Monoraphidium neglectum TaxID=145388 RepID=A0A0D2J807_9CHLO|nr:Transcription initiation factor TFIID subunit 1 [Monoraphidium neglectum]KIY95912.1 Transcription initiation factor TFIID subunit 1 [Monoraphidium neglectum]|eukprot:XP_013894932.1 Transcription initiation factor TFIID subunit 1 [Monoraphidium neglectum]